MKKIITLILTILFSLFISSPVKAYDPLTVQNNIYGIGIVNHSDLEDAANLVNVNGGDWGYVTVVITEKDAIPVSDKNKEVWQKFMDDCRRNHLIPIIRIASEYSDNSWQKPKVENIDSWINFLNSLNWVIKNRYVVISNEPNHAKEWGGEIKPAEYAVYLKTFTERLHNANPDFFVLNAGFDQASPNGKDTMDEKKYIKEMIQEVPDVFNLLDGWSSHSYPNPAFSGSKTANGKKSIRGYEWELEYLRSLGVTKKLPVFITETGWIRVNKKNSEDKTEKLISDNLSYAFQEVWAKDERIVAVTPFILNYQSDPFYEFSWKNKDGSYFGIYNNIQSIQKIKGQPIQKISGEIIFNFLNPLMLKNTEQKGLVVVKNTGQATWTEGESHVINESKNLDVKVSNTKFNQIEPFKTGLVIYTLKAPEKESVFDIKLGFYVRGERIGDVMNGKIISF